MSKRCIVYGVLLLFVILSTNCIPQPTAQTVEQRTEKQELLDANTVESNPISETVEKNKESGASRFKECSTKRITDLFTQVHQRHLYTLIIFDDLEPSKQQKANHLENLKTYLYWKRWSLSKDHRVQIVTSSQETQQSCPPFSSFIQINHNHTVKEKEHSIEKILHQYTHLKYTNKPSMGLASMEKILKASFLDVQKCKKKQPPNTKNIHILFITSRDDKSPKPVYVYMDFLNQLKTQKIFTDISISIVGVKKKNSCPDMHPPAEQTKRYNQMHYAFNKRWMAIQSSICKRKWSEHFTPPVGGTIGSSYCTTFFLTALADPDSIEVIVEGKKWPQSKYRWSYHPDDNSVHFRHRIPPFGTFFQVSYRLRCSK